MEELQEYTQEQMEEFAKKFAEKMYNQMVDIPQEFVDIVNKDFWNLITE